MRSENEIGKQIKILRSQRGWSQAQLADKLNVSKQSVSNWETGLKVPRMGALQKMSDLFRVSIGRITDGEKMVPNISSTLDEINDTVGRLDAFRQRRVLKFAKGQLSDQKDSFPETLAAHQADPNHVITDDESKNISDFLDDAIDKHNK